MLRVKSLHTVLICEKWEDCVSFYKDVLARVYRLFERNTAHLS
jgi:hypothetical protein